jgi:iron:rusticyanin reductase
MKLIIRVPVFICLVLILPRAHAVPSFARQTGLSCNVCHSNPPELTAFGRNFKLKGYVLANTTATDKVGSTKDLLLSKYIPLSVMVLLSNTSFQANQPATQNNAAGFPQQLSIFLAGGFASHFGGLAQITYTHSDDHFGMDNTDLRYANQGKLGGKDWEYGITLNNNPTVEDLWNTTPAWGFPWMSTASGVGPIASPIIQGALGQDVAGLGGYSMWNKPPLYWFDALSLGARWRSHSRHRNRTDIQH